MVAAILLSRYCARVLIEARASRRLFEANVQNLALRTHQAARSDQMHAKRSADLAEAASLLSKRILAAQEELARERMQPRAGERRRPGPEQMSRP
jgi:hypothetical protein